MPTATLITAHHILLTTRKPYHMVSFSVFEGSAQTMMSTWLNPRKWHRFFLTEDILVVLLPTAKGEPRRSAAKDHSAIPNEGTGPDTPRKYLCSSLTTQRTRKSRKFFSRTPDEPSLCAFIGGMQVSETSWFIAHCHLALIIPKPHQREHFLAVDPSTAHGTSREGRQQPPTLEEMFG